MPAIFFKEKAEKKSCAFTIQTLLSEKCTPLLARLFKVECAFCISYGSLEKGNSLINKLVLKCQIHSLFKLRTFELSQKKRIEKIEERFISY